MKAICNNMKYKVVKIIDPFVILEGIGGYTFKAYMENVLIEDEPEDKLLDTRPDTSDIVKKEIDILPETKEDKSLIIKEMPYVDTPSGKGFDLGLEMFNKKFGKHKSTDKLNAFIDFISQILSGDKVQFPEYLDPNHEKFGDMSIQLKSPEDIDNFINEMKQDEKLIKRDIGKDIKTIVAKAQEKLSTTSTKSTNNDSIIKKVATHPELIDAIKTVYSIRGVGDRKGEYSPERTVGMLKRAAEIITQYDRKPLTPENFLEKIIEWLKLSAKRGKGRHVNGLDELEKEILSDLDSDYKTLTENQQGIKMEPTLKKYIQRVIDGITGKQTTKETILELVPELQKDNTTLNKVIESLESIGVEIVDSLTENGVASAAGAGCADGTVNPAGNATQGVAIFPSRLGMNIRKRLEESVGLDIKLDENNIVAHAIPGQPLTRRASLETGIRERGGKQSTINTTKPSHEVPTAKIVKKTNETYTGLDDENPYNITDEDAEERHSENENRRKEMMNQIHEKVKSIMNRALDEEFEFDDTTAEDDTAPVDNIDALLADLDNI